MISLALKVNIFKMQLINLLKIQIFLIFTFQDIKNKIKENYKIEMPNVDIQAYLKTKLSLSFQKGSKKPTSMSIKRVEY